ncbi:MAG: preprotein translocase subunit SecG [Armatimonadota bacterium]
MLGFLTVAVLILDVVIIVAVALQTTKSEGLSGVIGGKSSSAFRKGGMDDLLEKVTKYSAIGWAVLVAVHAYLWYRLY